MASAPQSNAPQSNKVKIAKRVIEVFEYFDGDHRSATVMDIARRYGRPQSSTSELLSSLVELGFLYKNARARSYSLTPRVAILGAEAQPRLLRNGGLLSRMERLARNTGCGVALIGMVGVQAQIYRWVAGSARAGTPLAAGSSAPMAVSVAGMLLLSTQAPDVCSGMLRRLNAEADADRKFNHCEALEQVRVVGRQGWAAGPSGFDATADMVALLLPREDGERPLVLALLHDRTRAPDVNVLLSEMRAVVAECRDIAPEADGVDERPLPLLKVVGR